ncbi:MAG: NADH-ubiquinone oxidoreductase-F iron-sulfur binding region domain-containing protein [Halobacteriaceae archaeon]
MVRQLEETVVRVASRGDRGELEAALEGATDASVVAVGSTGARALEPLVLVSRAGTTAFFAGCTEQRAAAVADGLASGELPTERADAVVDHDPDRATLPVPDLSPLDVGTRSVLGRCGWVRPAERGDYRTGGDGEGGGLDADPAAVLDAAGGVVGRGWGDAAADEPLGGTWERVAGAEEPAVVVNAHGSPGDALLLESAPFLPLEGALAAARAVGAAEVVVYLSAADDLARERAAAAASDLADGVDVRVATGPDEHRAAEPTMALEAVEGNHRLEARLRPPGPAEAGLSGRPTLVHTPRTLAQVARALDGGDPTRVVTVRGDVGAEATVELPEGASLSALRGAVTVEGEFKGACVGGRFGGVTPDLDIAANADALGEAGLGTEGVVDIIAEGRCVVAYVGEKCRYGSEENCGRCVPCREGSKQLTELLREVYGGEFRPGRIEELLRVVRSTSVCGFGRDMTRPVATALDHFGGEFADHADGRCRAGACDGHLPGVTA